MKVYYNPALNYLGVLLYNRLLEIDTGLFMVLTEEWELIGEV